MVDDDKTMDDVRARLIKTVVEHFQFFALERQELSVGPGERMVSNWGCPGHWDHWAEQFVDALLSSPDIAIIDSDAGDPFVQIVDR